MSSEIVGANVARATFDEDEAQLVDWVTDRSEQIQIRVLSSIDEALDWVCDGMNRVAHTSIEIGVHLVWLKTQTEHGQWGSLLKARGINPSVAAKMMKVANAVIAVNDKSRKAMIQLPRSKALPIARMEPEQIEAFFEAHDPDELDAMPPGEVRDLCRRLKVQLDTEKTKSRNLVESIDAAATPGKAEWPTWVQTARDHGYVMAEQATLALDEFEAQALALAQNMVLDDATGMHINVAASSLHANLGAVAARVTQVMRTFQERFADYIEASDADLPLASDEEIRRLIQRRDLVVGTHNAAKVRAESRRQAIDTKRKPGRPKGSKNKAGAKA